VAYPTDVASIARNLSELHAMWRSGELTHSRRAAWTEEFSRRTQAERLIAYLERVVKPSAPARSAMQSVATG
jgi:hypothetical protein